MIVLRLKFAVFSNLLSCLNLLLGVGLAAGLVGCEKPEPHSGVSFVATWLTERGRLPPEVTGIRVRITDSDGEVVAEQELERSAVDGMDENGDGRPELGFADLPTSAPIRLELVARTEASDEAFVAHAGPFELDANEERSLALQLYPVGEAADLEEPALPGRFLHTATRLLDGRVLVAGGFTQAEADATCPDGAPAETRCFLLTASNEAYVFNPATGLFAPVQGTMGAARAGHSATLLGDGRVLVAGGAERALLMLEPRGAEQGFEPKWISQRGDGQPGAHATFELFDPSLAASMEDGESGGFIGAAAEPGVLGELNDERFLHAAAVWNDEENEDRPDELVMLAGGLSGTSVSRTFELFDPSRTGGYGVRDNTQSRLLVPRATPAAVTVGRTIWIVGGAEPPAADNEALAEIWDPSAEGEVDFDRATQPASNSIYPDDSLGSAAPRPHYALSRPDTFLVNEGRSLVVNGWLGPRCRAGEVEPAFPRPGEVTLLCARNGGPSRSHTISVENTAEFGSTRQTSLGVHGWGDAATLSGRIVLLSGGFADETLAATNLIDVLTGAVQDGEAQRAGGSGDMFSLLGARALHRMTSIGVGQVHGVLVTGGLNIGASPPAISILGTAEVLYIPSSL